jgi:hypothetical protein
VTGASISRDSDGADPLRFVLVEDVADKISNIVPASACRVISKLTAGGKMTDVVERLPGVTARRLDQYRGLYTSLGIPIVQIRASDATQVNGAYFGNLYDAEAGVRFRYIPGQMVEHGSAEHRRLQGVATARTLLESKHRCDVCKPPK